MYPVLKILDGRTFRSATRINACRPGRFALKCSREAPPIEPNLCSLLALTVSRRPVQFVITISYDLTHAQLLLRHSVSS